MFSPVFNPSGVQITGATLLTTFVSGLASTFAPPPGAIAFLIQNDATSSDSIRWAAGVAANASVGFLMEVSRDSGYVYAGVTLSVVSVSSATQAVNLQWFTGA